MNFTGPATESDDLPYSYGGHACSLKVSSLGCVGQICKLTETSEEGVRHAVYTNAKRFTQMPNQTLASCHCL